MCGDVITLFSMYILGIDEKYPNAMSFSENVVLNSVQLLLRKFPNKGTNHHGTLTPYVVCAYVACVDQSYHPKYIKLY